MRQTLRLLAAALCLTGCSHARPSTSSAATASAVDTTLIGEFADDYGSAYTISGTEWRHGARARYHITKWVADQQYLIAHNNASNPSDAGLWTRIDWVRLDMPPYTWAFCMSAYKAPTAAAAESTLVARRDTPRTGCNGFPFSRMKRL